MAISLETQEILIAFATENKDNYQSWGKYELDELQFAWSELPDEDKGSAAGKRIQERIKELESGKDHLEDIEQEEAPDDPRNVAEQPESPELAESTEPTEPTEPAKPTEQAAEESKNNTPYIIGGIIIVVIIVCLALYLF